MASLFADGMTHTSFNDQCTVVVSLLEQMVAGQREVVHAMMTICMEELGHGNALPGVSGMFVGGDNTGTTQ